MSESKNYTMIMETIKNKVIKMVSRYYNEDSTRWNDDFEALVIFLETKEHIIQNTVEEIFEEYKVDDKTELNSEKDSQLINELDETFSMFLSSLKNECIRYLNLLSVYRFIKSRVIKIVSESYKQDMNCDDDEVTNFLKNKEKEIHSMSQLCLNIYNSDNDDSLVDSAIIKMYNTMVQF